MRTCACGCGVEFKARNRNHRFATPSCRARGDAPVETDDAEVPDPPPWLGEAPRAVWSEYAPLVFASGADMLTARDVVLFATFCEAVAHLQEACEILDATAVILDDGKGKFSTNPAWQVARQQARLVLQLGEAFGMTPRARGLLVQQPDGGPAVPASGQLPEGVTPIAGWVADLAGAGGPAK